MRSSKFGAILLSISVLALSQPAFAIPGKSNSKNINKPAHGYVSRAQKLYLLDKHLNKEKGNVSLFAKGSAAAKQSLLRLQERFNRGSENLFDTVKSAVKYLKTKYVNQRLPHKDSAGDPKTDFHRSGNKGHKDLKSNNGLRGDPKFGWVGSENKMHSPNHRLDDNVIDLTTWEIRTSYFDGDGNLHVFYTPTNGENYDYVELILDPATLAAIEAWSVSTETTDTLPDLSGFQLVTSSTGSDGSVVETWLNLPEGSSDWSDAKVRIRVSYGSDGMFLEAEIRTTELLELDSVIIPEE